MDKRVKFTFKEKLWAVRTASSGRWSCLDVARELGCNRSTVRSWLSRYKLHGSKGLKIRNGSYDGRFKIRVIRHMLRNGLSLSQTATLFGIPERSAVSRWLRTYEQLGAAGLLAETRGRIKRQMAPKDKRKEKIDLSDPNADKLLALQKEVEYLRAENAFLKKLEALIQQDKAAKAQSRRSKPSGN